MRGTRGYISPEWLSRRIAEKVDECSFGVVILEVVCGRRNLDFSQPDEDDYLLLPILKQKAEKNLLFDMVDNCIEGIYQNAEEVVKMIRIAICFLTTVVEAPAEVVMVPSSPQPVSVLSGSR
ncbi:hypothetical protein CRYUN_Cryun34aG0075700 [Craigia yunnanensis]